MRVSHRRWVLGVSAALILVGTLGTIGAAPANAAPPEPAAAPSATVEGKTWSGPAFPVTCTGSTARISCMPDNVTDSTSERCFAEIPHGGASVTVCTQTEDNVGALTDAGGTELKLEYGCGPVDAVCTVGEMISRGLASVITGGIASVIDNTSFNTSSSLWSAAISEWAWWSWVVLLVILIAGIVAIITALWSRDGAELTAAIIRFLLAVPLSAGSLWLVGNIVNVVDQLVDPLLTRGGQGEGLYRTIENIIFGGGGGNIFLAQIVLTFLTIGVIVLVFVFSFRNLALAALVALGPVAFMLFPMKIGVQWVVRWFSAVIALILTTPLTLGFLMLVLRGFAEVDSMWSIQAIPLALGMIMIAFAPIAVFGLFSFVGAGATSAIDNIASRGGSTAKQSGGRAVRSLSSAVASRTAAARRRTPSAPSGGGPTARTTPGHSPSATKPTPSASKPAGQPAASAAGPSPAPSKSAAPSSAR
ncbi:hypothetical protein D6T64_04545 [Cryobacterium melibiosiphilum]|uniref:Type IV secretion system protein n=1 Tax=Cryobacterium melibiosiphilum TaxID=995039 RepID=A0A3A5MW06_9MICO|nr:hypothetical protein [Cryobacterium melibiosiphilum]RJT90196.1 hypothetical protein D6T64_04545 [Cryobacterium melibiosiphilum]